MFKVLVREALEASLRKFDVLTIYISASYNINMVEVEIVLCEAC